MIRFSDVREVLKDANAPEKPHINELTREMSAQEVNQFWRAEFANAKKNVDVDREDRLFAEAFNRADDEIAIVFDIDKQLGEFLREFTSENWSTMDETQRMVAARETIKEVADRLGMDRTPRLSLYDGEKGNYGYFYPEKNEIQLNRNYLGDSIETLDTLMHELRHAYQRFRAEKHETWEDQLFDYNFANYIMPIQLPDGNYLLYTDYQNQYVEVDARAFANKITEAMKV